MAGGNSVLVLQKCVNSFSGCLWGMFSNQQLGSLKSNPMARRRLADILHLSSWQTSHALFNQLLATIRRRSIPFSGCLQTTFNNKDSLKTLSTVFRLPQSILRTTQYSALARASAQSTLSIPPKPACIRWQSPCCPAYWLRGLILASENPAVCQSCHRVG